MNQLLKVPEAAKRLSLSETQVRRLLATGQLIGVNVATEGARERLFIESDEVARFIESNRKTTKPKPMKRRPRNIKQYV